ncbi:MAG: hypothetical protein QX199_14700 [Methylococcaceae bacterium]
MDTLAPTAPTINIVATNDIINAAEQTATVTVTGTNETGATTTLNGNAVTQNTATTWSYVLSAAAITAFGQGDETLTAVSTDTAGNSANATRFITVDTIAPGAPSITSVTDDQGSITGTVADNGRTDDTQPVVRVSLSGASAVFGDTVQLYNSGSALGSATTLSGTDIINGYVDITTSALSNGSTYVLTAKVIDVAGNTGTASASHTITIDTTAPGAPSITSVTDDQGTITGTVADNGRTDDTQPVVRVSLSGTNAVSGDTVQLYNSGSALGSATTLTATNITNTYVDITTTALSNGSTYVLTAKAIDAVGNTGTASASHTITIDTTAPGAPSITSVTDDQGTITGTVADNGRTDDTQPVVRVSLSGTNAASGDTVQLYNSGSALGSATALTATNITNTYVDITTTVLSNGSTYVLTAKVIDAAGNTGAASSSHTITVDTAAPTLSPVTIASNNANPAVAVVGDIVTLIFTANESIQATASVTIAGHTVTPTPAGPSAGPYTATYTMTAADTSGVVPFTINFTDLVGNAGTQVSTTTNSSSVTFVNSLNCTSAGNGNWSSITWSNCRGGVPLAGDNATIATNVTLNINTPTLNSLTIDSAGILTNTGSNTITLSGAMSNAGTYSGGSGTITVGGSFTNTGSYSAGSATTTLSGNFSNSGTFTAGTGTWLFSGSSAQTLTGITSFNNLTVNNANGVALNANVSVSTSLTLTNGHISTGSNILILSANCTAPSWSRGSGFVAGNLRLTFPSGTITCTYPVGSDSNYAPISLTMVSAGGTLTGSTTGYEHPMIAFSTIDPTLDANRYWTLGATGDTITATSYSVTVNFQSGDLDINAVPASFIVGKYASGVWTMPTSTSGTSSSTASSISGPITIPTDFTVGQIPVPCTVPSGLPSNMTCVCDNFGRSNLNPSTIYGADWFVANQNNNTTYPCSTFSNPIIANSGFLRLTNNCNGRATVANVPSTFPAAGNLIVVEFKHYAYNGTGADGIALTLSDSTMAPTPGAFGGSLGYAQKIGSDCATPGGCPGFNGGWVGIAIDEYGNFSANTEGRTGVTTPPPTAPGLTIDSVSVRGSGSGLIGYPYLGGSATLSPGIDNASSTTAAYGHLYKITVDARNYTWNGSSGTKSTTVAVDRDTTGVGTSYSPVVSSFDAFTVNPSQAAVPTNWKLSFTGSTGGSNNIHEISGLKICAQTITPPAGYRIQVDNLSPSICTSADNGKPIVTVTALDSSGNTVTGYTNPVTLTARIGSSIGSVSTTAAWTSLAGNQGGFSGNTYTFNANDQGVARFQLTDSTTENIYIVVSESVSGSTLASSLITPVQFSGGAFSVSENDSLAGVVAGRPHLMRITRTNGCGTDTTYSGSKALDSWYTPTTFDHPAGAFAPQICATNAGGTCLPETGGSCQVQSIAPPAVSSGSNNLTINFTSGIADFCLVTSDVGKYSVSVRDDSNVSSPITGSGSTLTARPFVVVVSDVKQGTLYNSANNTSGGSVFAKAGTSFQAAAGGYLWNNSGIVSGIVGNGDSNGDGLPDLSGVNYATMTLGGLASHYADTVTLAANTSAAANFAPIAPPATQGSLNGSSVVVTAGSATTSALSYSEVGSFTLKATPSVNYLNSSVDLINRIAIFADSASQTSWVGRFIPDHFTLTQGAVTPACDTFSYFGQDGFSTAFTLTAKNSSDAITQNYQGDYAKLTLTTWANFGFTVTSPPVGSVLSAGTPGIPPPTGSWANGAATVTARHQLSRPAALTGETNVVVQAAPVDSDGVTMTATDIIAAPGTPLRYGRLALQNAYGSELLDLPMPLTAEYWNGSSWVSNAADSCTALVAPTVGNGGLALNLANAGTTAAATWNSPLVSGDGGLSLGAPGATHTGYVDVTVASPAWLDFNWRGAGDTDPSARATFGIYTGNNNFIYIRELY